MSLFAGQERDTKAGNTPQGKGRVGWIETVALTHLQSAVLGCVLLCLTLCDHMDCSAPRLLYPWGFSRQEYWSVLPCPPPGDLPNPEIEPGSPVLQADSLPSELQGSPTK